MSFLRSVWFKWLSVGLLLGGGGLGLLLWWGVPWGLQQVLQGPVSDKLGRALRAQSIDFQPWDGRLVIQGLAIAGATPGQDSLLTLDRLDLDVAVFHSLLRLAPVVEGLEVVRPVVRVARVGAGRYDFDDVLSRLSTPPSPDEPKAQAPLPRFGLHNIRLVGGELLLDDRPVGRRHHVQALQVALPFLFHLDHQDVETVVEPALSLRLNGAVLAARAEATPLAPNRAGRLEFSLSGFALGEWREYLPAAVPVIPESGQLDLRVALDFSAPAQATPALKLSGSVRVADLVLRERTASGQPGGRLLQLQRAQLDVQAVDPSRRRVGLEALTLKGLDLWVERRADGRLSGLPAGPSPSQAAAAPSEPPKPQVPAAGGPTGPSAWQLALQRLDLQDIRLHWRDRVPQPSAEWDLKWPRVSGHQLAWPLVDGAAPGRLAAEMWLHSAREGGQTMGHLDLQGHMSTSGTRVTLLASDLDLDLVGPYLRSHLAPRLRGLVGLQAEAAWAGSPDGPPTELRVVQADLRDLAVHEPGEAANLPAARWRRLAVRQAQVDLAAHRVQVEEVRWTAPQLLVRRDAQGQLNVARWLHPGRPEGAVVASTAAPSSPPATAAPAWSLGLQRFVLEDAALQWRDAWPAAGPVAMDLDRLQLTVGALAWPPAPGLPVAVAGSAQVRAPGAERQLAGQMGWRGQMGLAPLAWRGQAQIERLPVHLGAAYAGQALPARLVRALLGWRGQTELRLAPAGLQLQTQGDARLTDVLVRTRAEGLREAEDLLSWQALNLSGLSVQLQPGRVPQLALAEASLTDFFASILIDEQGGLNLAPLVPAPAQGAVSAPAAVAAAPAPADAASAPVVVSASREAPPAAVFEVGALRLRNGRVEFTDRFIRPQYSASLSELNGYVGRLSSGSRDMAPVEISGLIAGTGLLDVRGGANPLVKPPVLDLRAKAQDIELAPLSAYAAKYAGYGIERGKLSVHLAYRVDPGGALQAENQLVLNQLTFGDASNSAEATKLPVRLALALLSDRHGVIDVNLPVSGSLSDPQFSVGQVVLKLLGNMLVKAATAPFALLMGAGEAAPDALPFPPGLAQPAPEALGALDALAGKLKERPGLQLGLTGLADPQQEREAMRNAWLEQQLRIERRKELLAAGAALDVEVSPPQGAERERLLRALHKSRRGASWVGPFQSTLPVAQVESELRATHVVGEDQARELALQRGMAVRDALIARGVSREQLFLGAPRLHLSAEDEGGAPWSPRVLLGLETR
ncbi:DUF748 domain-containing protein [Ideonella livida]|uniref:DUF748 domain-containing protein n=1 Tax=Ideonella livida TaxID=2707176 RepID=A0A7C9TIZ6_9BURK|nr:DUF748 domain-containing protein [Ideonella livida]NDY91719.1 DUF748 domain-containing protein [Ideonella livida]